jgi:peptide/nickel transport system ATP-binding protein
MTGCAFRNRCRFTEARCAGAAIALDEIAPGRAYRCVMPPTRCAENALEAAE